METNGLTKKVLEDAENPFSSCIPYSRFNDGGTSRVCQRFQLDVDSRIRDIESSQLLLYLWAFVEVESFVDGR